MTDRGKVISGLEHCTSAKTSDDCKRCPYYGQCVIDPCALERDALELLKEQESRELTKEEWEQWKKNERREPICMVWHGDTTPFWVLKPESINEPLYLMGKIKLFTKKPSKEQVKWDE